LPREQRNRFEEEWSSHLNEIPGELGKVIAALGFIQASRCMALGVTPLKRAADMTIAGILVLFCAPLFFFVPLLIKIDSPGPIFVTRHLKGSNGLAIPVLEFRTGKTRIGRAVRLTGYHRLPYLINVLRGQASLPPFKDYAGVIRRRLGFPPRQ
jgi:hypothetical protein